MRRKIQIGSAVLVLVAAVAAMVLIGREYRRDTAECRLLYTRSVKMRDVVDAANNALSALVDAGIREQEYVLTGETVYSEAYSDDIRNWRDEYSALELVAANDSATTPLVKDFSKAGARVLAELDLVLSLYDKNGRDAAVDRIRKSTGVVYLDQARNSVAKIQEIDGAELDRTNRRLTTLSVSSLRRVAAAGGALFVLTVAATLLLILEVRQRHPQSTVVGE
jgi:CHASE3 domain sensor protein